jgi:hypothetical protein
MIGEHRWERWCVLSVVAVLMATPRGAQTAQTGHGDGGWRVAERQPTMHMVLERTIFQVDILTLDIWFAPDVHGWLMATVSGRELSPALGDSLAALALDARDVVARLHFKHGVSFDQFIRAIADNARHARDEGIIPRATYDDIVRSLPTWYAFLKERKIHEGDEMTYRIRGDTLRTVFQSVEGVTLLDQVDVGSDRRLAVMGGYFAPKSDFRKRLLESLFDE